MYCVVSTEDARRDGNYTVWKYHSWDKDKGLLEHIEGHKAIFTADTGDNRKLSQWKESSGVICSTGRFLKTERAKHAGATELRMYGTFLKVALSAFGLESWRLKDWGCKTLPVSIRISLDFCVRQQGVSFHDSLPCCGKGFCVTHRSYEPCHARPPKTDRS